MPLAFYVDHHVPRAITLGLSLRGVRVITAEEDGRQRASDEQLLDRASQLDRVLFTQDDDLLAEAAKRQREGRQFSGVVYGHQLRLSIGECIDELELVAKAGAPDDVLSQVVFLPLK